MSPSVSLGFYLCLDKDSEKMDDIGNGIDTSYHSHHNLLSALSKSAQARAGRFGMLVFCG